MSELYGTYLEVMGHEPGPMPDDAQEAADALPDDVSVDDIAGCTRWLRSDPYLVRNKQITFSMVCAEVEYWRRMGRPFWKKRSGGKPSEPATDAQRRYLTRLGFPMTATDGWTKARATGAIDEAKKRQYWR